MLDALHPALLMTCPCADRLIAVVQLSSSWTRAVDVKRAAGVVQQQSTVRYMIGR